MHGKVLCEVYEQKWLIKLDCTEYHYIQTLVILLWESKWRNWRWERRRTKWGENKSLPKIWKETAKKSLMIILFMSYR